MTDIQSLVLTGAGSISMLMAGAGFFRLTHSGARFFEKTEAKAVQVADTFLETQGKIMAAQERQAVALETTANLIPLLENINENQRQVGGTLRVMNRKLQELEDLKETILSQMQLERGKGSDDSTIPVERS